MAGRTETTSQALAARVRSSLTKALRTRATRSFGRHHSADTSIAGDVDRTARAAAAKLVPE